VESVTFSVGFDSNNGFDLLWRVLELTMPGFKSTNPVQVRIWSPTSDILSFCRKHLLYFRLQSKHNMFFNARTQTNIFLHNIQHSEYADVITTLQSHVNAYLCEKGDGYLPSNLCIDGIAMAIHLNASARVRNVGLGSPRVRRTFGNMDLGHHTSGSPLWDDELPLCLVQGYSPWAFQLVHGCGNNRGTPTGRRPFVRDGRQDARGGCDNQVPSFTP
jgi:hypothetical protein